MSVCLDLFAGLGGFSSAFEEAEEWEVFTVDIEEKFEPDLVADVMDLTHRDLPEADVVLASPPCTAFSIASAGHHWQESGDPATEHAKESILLVYHTVGLIESVGPNWWFMENPRGMLRKKFEMPAGTVWWCQYGDSAAKPTDLWGEHPPSFEYQSCHNGNPNCHHDRAPRGAYSGTQGKQNPAEKAKIPRGLSEAVLDSVENPSIIGNSAMESEW